MSQQTGLTALEECLTDTPALIQGDPLLRAGPSHRSLQTASSGSMQNSMLRMGGGLPLGEQFRSLERSLGSECSPATSYGTHEGGDDLEGITQANMERNQQMYVRYSGMSEGEHAALPPRPSPAERDACHLPHCLESASE